jgi:hypothetical protein
MLLKNNLVPLVLLLTPFPHSYHTKGTRPFFAGHTDFKEDAERDRPIVCSTVLATVGVFGCGKRYVSFSFTSGSSWGWG